MTEILEHYSCRQITEIAAIDFWQETAYKPHAFWVSVKGEDDWPSWCKSEDFGMGNLGFRHVIALAPHANILRLSSVRDIDDFDSLYASSQGAFSRRSGIRWFEVAEQYDGVIIAPYQWARRMEGQASEWYYGWDVASGAIWNTSILSISACEPAISL